MSDTLALLALMKKDEGLTEEQVNQVIDNKNLQPKLTAGTNITIDSNNVISSIDTGLTQEQINTLIDNKNLQPKLTAGDNITIDENNVISAIASGGGSGGVEIIDRNITQDELLAMPGRLFIVPGDKVITLSVYLQETNSVEEWNIGGSLYLWNSIDGILSEFASSTVFMYDGSNFTISSSTGVGYGLEDIDGIICSRGNCYNFKTNEELTDIGLKIVKDLWTDRSNFTKYNLTFNGEPVHNVTKDETNNQLVFTVLRATGTETQPGISRVNRIIIVNMDENGITGYEVQNIQNPIVTVGHTDEQINAMIDTKLGVIENGSY